MYVAIMNSDWDLRVPVGAFLVATQDVVVEASVNNAVREKARRTLRIAWRALRDESEWAACVYALRTRAILSGKDKPEQCELEGRKLCATFRESYPKAPPGFERIGRSAEGRIPFL